MSQRGGYQTRRQDAVLALFSGSPEACYTVEDAYEKLHADDIGKTTIYRIITRLSENGLLRRYSPHERGEAACYQYNPCQESHLHMRCTRCGAVTHLHCDEAEAFAGHLTNHHGFVLDESQTILYGICGDCLAKEEK